ncbi:MAG: PhzF family phenazine biosynthesis protein [Dehalococcoidia bacterium]|jgi:PhzF family phenazine biosynthesis protein|nr:PhzF family phenazine biosynthesis protein [Dehalococcoidia bacterium]
MKIPVYQVDTFTVKPFSGNPAAVCPLTAWIPDDVMQAIAAEMNLSETAFFVPGAGDRGEYDLRWFTPAVEVDLCGHATLASGHVILDELDPTLERITFHTRSGPLGVSRRNDLFELDFPSHPPKPASSPEALPAVSAALGNQPTEILHANTTLAVFENQGQVAALEPDFDAISRLQEPWLIATAPADSDEFDFVSRFFAPTAEVNEDPVTGFAHTILTPYWAERLDKTRLTARQISKRGGTLHCELAGDRVKIAGQVARVMTGELDIQF